uniref:Transmembrane protein 14C n=1 Tax=Ditylenchus dipsaci TaxID=166011 RepID=A0A915DFG3_9BILA
MPADAFGVVYAGLVAAGSIPSLVAGLVAGSIAAFAALTSNFYILTTVGVVLGGVMSVRFAKSGKFMPAGIIALLSILIVIRCIVYFTAKK